MKKWKKTAAFGLAICMLLYLCACGSSNGEKNNGNTESNNIKQEVSAQPENTNTSNAAESEISETAVPESKDSDSANTDTSNSDTQKSEETRQAADVTDEPEADADIEVLDLQKQLYGFYEWEEDYLLVQSEYSHVTLWEEDAAKYPEMAEILRQKAAMIKRSMEDEYDNFCVSAREEMAMAGQWLDTWVSTLDIQVRRADSVAISLLSDSYSDYGWIEEFRGMHGSNYDTQTGQELMLSDVIKDIDAIPALVEQELNSHMWAGDFSYDGVVTDYFNNTPEDGISWTLDYNGVTFYFTDGDLAEIGFGRQTATVDFARYPELFYEKYMAVPDAYMVELPMDNSFFTDLNEDGDLEELNITGFFNTDVGLYTEFGIYTDTDGCFQYEECFADGFIPYYVKTADGSELLYLFCEENEGMGQMFTLKVYDIKDGKVTGMGDMHAGPGYIPTGIFRVPTDPDQFYLDDFDSMAQDMMPYAVGANKLPELRE